MIIISGVPVFRIFTVVSSFVNALSEIRATGFSAMRVLTKLTARWFHEIPLNSEL